MLSIYLFRLQPGNPVSLEWYVHVWLVFDAVSSAVKWAHWHNTLKPKKAINLLEVETHILGKFKINRFGSLEYH